MQKTTFRVPGMSCPNCVMRIEALEDELDGVLQVRASYQKARVDVEFDETRISPAQIVSALTSLGYPPSDLETPTS
jgi:copper ion binding protein